MNLLGRLYAPPAHSKNACALLGILNPDIEAAFPTVQNPGANHHPYSVYHLRAPTIPDAVKQDYLNTARRLGFRVDQLVWVKQ